MTNFQSKRKGLSVEEKRTRMMEFFFEKVNCITMFNPFPNDKFWTLPISKSLQMTILSLMKIVESFSKWVENTMGKGEIARYEQCLLFPQCFQMICTADM